uniref:Uncharacterized protein n=1 Tax=Physcomitrium patens TaxID=3218 RepID=A0A2K1L188_PHYPA|nr:hypothetical protein PHYPA_002585 [Physcomitrium patens]
MVVAVIDRYVGDEGARSFVVGRLTVVKLLNSPCAPSSDFYSLNLSPWLEKLLHVRQLNLPLLLFFTISGM